MKLNGLQVLYNDMKQQNIDRYRFTYTNGKGIFDIFFFIDETPFVLLFGAQKANFSFELEVQKGFNIDTMLSQDIYFALRDYLGIKSSSGNPFSSNKFFNDFDINIPNTANINNIPKPHQVIKYRNNVEESDKIYFLKWLDNTKQNNQVSDDNLKKTKDILGQQAYLRCKKKNISSCWTEDSTKQKNFTLP